MSLKCTLLNEKASLKRLPTVLFHLYDRLRDKTIKTEKALETLPCLYRSVFSIILTDLLVTDVIIMSKTTC